MLKSLPQPSDGLQKLISTELALPTYQGEDEDMAMADALKSLLATHGSNAFDPFNPTDQILLGLAQE